MWGWLHVSYIATALPKYAGKWVNLITCQFFLNKALKKWQLKNARRSLGTLGEPSCTSATPTPHRSLCAAGAPWCLRTQAPVLSLTVFLILSGSLAQSSCCPYRHLVHKAMWESSSFFRKSHEALRLGFNTVDERNGMWSGPSGWVS
jgi:hypothetical protein